MMLRSSVDFQMPRIAGEMKIFETCCMFIKQLTYKRLGDIWRLGLIILVLFGVYFTSSYVSSTPEVEPYSEDNITLFAFEQNIEKIDFVSQKPFIPNEVVFLLPGVSYGEIVLNCGLPKSCEENKFPVHIYTGKDHKDEPRFCIDGKYILTKTINGGGRGINVIVVDNMTRTVIRVSHFDTYERESTPLETLLLTLRPGDIVVLLTFDEPTRKMSRVARLLLFELGSALIQNLNYRGSWYLVSQKGINGFSPFESLHSVESNGWPTHHDEHFCVPFQIKGRAIHPDPLPRTNPARVEFCEIHGDFPLFCDSDAVNDPLLPAPFIKRLARVKQIYNIPILVMSGESITYLPITLETLIRQPGINPSIVVVFYLPRHTGVPALCDLFGFMSVELSQVVSYCDRVDEAFETGNLLFPDAKEIVFLGENVVLAPDFLFFMGQCLPLLQVDETLFAISAFNENGFQDTSFEPKQLHRVSTFTGFAFLVRRNFFQKSWCANNTENDRVYISNQIKGDVVIPDVSRILIAKPNSSNNNYSSWFPLHFRQRRVSYDDDTLLTEIGKLREYEYQMYLDELLKSAKSIPFASLECSPGSLFSIPETQNDTGQVYALYIHQRKLDDFFIFQSICRCFSLPIIPFSVPPGFYKGLLRLTWDGNHVFVIGSYSPFYKHKPLDVKPIKFNFIT